MTTLKSRAGAAKLGAPLMVLSFLLVVGFMYWLSVTAEPTEVMVVEDEAALENVVAFDVFSAGPGEYLGEVVSLEGVPVTSAFGNHGRWVQLADGNRTGFLLHYSDSLRADTTVALTELTDGMTVNLTGLVVATTDSVLDAWDAAGAFGADVDRIMAQSTYHLSFIEVTLIEMPESPDPGGEGDDSGSDEGNGP